MIISSKRRNPGLPWLAGVACLLAALWSGIAHADVPQSERDALMALYNSAGGANWTQHDHWNTTDPVCPSVSTDTNNWFGIRCDGTGTTVVTIYLNKNNLNGPLVYLNGLPNLQTFSVDENNLTGSIPPLVGLSGNLITFSVGSNKLTGHIPTISNLKKLQYFNVAANSLDGSVPDLTGLPSLYLLDMANNKFSGEIPSLSGLTSLMDLFLNNNNLSGSIPSLSGLVNLQNVYLYGNKLTGKIPSLSGLTELGIFEVYLNQLDGAIPVLSGLKNLYTFDVSNNNLSGQFPDLSSLDKLSSFVAHDNKLTGPIPALSGLTSLDQFLIGRNQLSGSIPALNGLTNLNDFDVSENKLTGSIPPLASLTHLTDIGLNNNRLTGIIPALPDSLEYIYVDNNGLSGALPPAPSKLSGKQSRLCPNLLDHTDSAAWDAAVRSSSGSSIWYTDCTTKATTTKIDSTSPILATTGATISVHIEVGAVGSPSEVPGGDVILGDSLDANATCSATLSNYTADCTLIFTTPGRHVLTAGYSGNATYAPSNGTFSIGVAAHADIPSAERAALIALYNNTNGPQWTNSAHWNTTDQVCPGTPANNWAGVTCNSDNTSVTEINLYNNNLSGSLISLEGLPNLLNFNASYNQLTGQIPSLSKPAKLQFFSVQKNFLSGQIPTFSDPSQLLSFNAATNNLTGQIPSLSGLVNLQGFNVADNKLTGQIPPLSGLTNLNSFVVSYNELTGPIPSLSGLTHLQSFFVSENQLTGSIPPMSELTELEFFGASSNQLTGALPSLSGLNSVTLFLIDHNGLTGPLPAAPVTLYPGQSALCPNLFDHTESADWDAATSGSSSPHWYSSCTTVASTVTISSVSPNPAAPGATITVDFNVAPATSSTTVPGGSATVSDSIDTNETCTVATLSAGMGSCTLVLATAGTHTLTVGYGGDSTYAPTSNTASVIVAAASLTPTTTTLKASPSPGSVGQAVTFTTTVAAASGNAPGGSVVISDGTHNCTATLTAGTGASSTGSCPITFAVAGTFALTASYGGDATHAASNGTVSETVSSTPPTSIATTTVLTASANPGMVGQAITLTSVVTTASGTAPSGTVAISDGTHNCTATLTAGTGASSTGSCPITFASAGTFTLTASYGGDATHAASSGTLNETIGSAPPTSTTTALTITPNPAAVGQAVTASVSVGSAILPSSTTTAQAAEALAAAAPGGTVNVSDGTTNCSAALDANGQGNCALVFTTPGVRTITAGYSGDDTHAASSTSVSESVNAVTSPSAPAVAAPMLDRWALLMLIAGLAAVATYRRRPQR